MNISQVLLNYQHYLLDDGKKNNKKNHIVHKEVSLSSPPFILLNINTIRLGKLNK